MNTSENTLYDVIKKFDERFDENNLEKTLIRILKEVNKNKLIDSDSSKNLIRIIQGKLGSKTLEDAINENFQKYPQYSPIFHLQMGIEALKLEGSNYLANGIQILVREAEAGLKDGEDFINAVFIKTEKWYDHIQDRLAGWYKRKTNTVALIVGLLLAIILNVDTFNIAISLWKEPALRKALVTQPENVTPEQLEAEFGTDTDLKGQIQDFSKMLTDDLELPVGWHFRSESNGILCIWLPVPKMLLASVEKNYELGIATQDGQCKKDFFTIGSKVLGISITGIAAAQNSNFWFDVLDKFINIRNTGKKPTSSTDSTEKNSKEE